MIVSGIVAEMSNAHNGDRDRALRIIEACANAGVDWMKFQCYTPSELVVLRGDGPAPEPWGSQGWTMRDLYDKAQTPHEWFPDLVAKCKEVGLPWFSSVFGEQSLGLLERLGCPVYKLASLDRDAEAFRAKVMSTGKPIIQSMPADMPEVDATKLFCPPGYPQQTTDIEVSRALGHWADGFSFHGTDPKWPLHAKRCGAGIIEVHVQLDDEPSEFEAGVSLTITQLRQLTGKPQPARMTGGKGNATVKLEVLK